MTGVYTIKTKRMDDISLLFLKNKKNLKNMVLVLSIIGICLLIWACLKHSPDKIDEAKIEYEKMQAYYDKKYANEPEPPKPISNLLALLETCVGGQYVIGGQGDRLTYQFLKDKYSERPGAFSEEQLEYLTKIAYDAEKAGGRFPYHYAWDCSGLWWWGCNELSLYPKTTDGTAYITYFSYCTPISKDDLRPGDLVFYQNKDNFIMHMGIVGRKGYIFESVGVFGGVVKRRTLDERVYEDKANGGSITRPSWNVFGRPNIFQKLK